MTVELGNRFHVGKWSIDGNSLTATTKTDSNALEPRAFQVLRTLASKPGEVVSIDQLMDAHWQGTVVTPNAVTRVIAQLRRALNDDAKNPHCIETVTRTGYRLIAPVRPYRHPQHRVRLTLVAAISAVVVVLVTATGFWIKQESAQPTLTVLPFRNLTGDETMNYLAGGLAEEMARALTDVQAIAVNSQAWQRMDAIGDPVQSGLALGSRYVVTGSVRRAGSRLRLTATLVETNGGRNLWTNTEEVVFPDVFQGYDQLSREATNALSRVLQVDPPSYLTASAPDPQAYDLYLRGRHVWHRRGTLDLQVAIDSYAEAVKLDPDFAQAWSGLASAYLTYPSYSPKGYATWRLAEDAAKKANELDPNLADPYAVLASFANTRFEWNEAERQFLEALRLNEQNPTVHYWYGEHLAMTGRYEQSIFHMQRALELDPTYLAPKMDLTYAHMQFRNYEKAAAGFAELWEKGFQSPECWVGNFVSSILLEDVDAARQWLAEGPMGEADKQTLARFIDTHIGGKEDPQLVADIFDTPGVRIDYRMLIWMLAELEHFETTFELIEARLDRGLSIDPRPLWNPGIEIGAHPDFGPLLERLNLIDYWQLTGWGDVCREENSRLVCDNMNLTPERIEALLANDRPSERQ